MGATGLFLVVIMGLLVIALGLTAAALARARARERALLEHAPEAVLVFDPGSGRVLEGNDKAAELFGVARGELGGRDLATLSPPAQADGRRSALAGQAYLRAAAEGARPSFDWLHQSQDGREIPCETRLVRLPGVPPRIRASILDVSERHYLEAMRRRAADLAEQNRLMRAASRLKNDFLANMSHELRTPLNAIIGFAELMVDGRTGPLAADQREYLGDILSSGRHLLTLINDVLDLAKVESGRMEFRPEEVSPRELAEEVTGVLRSLMAQKRIRARVHVDPGLDTVTIDPGKLKQVLYNYLSNAVKFTPDEGSVALSIDREGQGRFRVAVTDSGIGIRPEDQPRLFVEFSQLDSGPGKRYPGTGLGLVLTKRIVEAQGGSVAVTSQPGKGSTFSAVLPCQPGPAGPADAPATAAGAGAGTGAPCVLVIEDSAAERGWLERELAAAGYDVEVAATVAQAEAALRERRFDAVTLDLVLPDASGLELLRRLRAGGPNADVPVVVVSVRARENASALAGFAVHDVLAKPADSADLLRTLRRAGVSPDSEQPVLVVDDDTRALKLMEAALEGLGYRALCLPDPLQAMDVARRQKPSAVILDLMMPGMDGFQLLRLLKDEPATHRIPVVIWTAQTLAPAEREQLLAGARAVVAKGPAGHSELLRELGAVVQPRARRAPPGDGPHAG